MRIWLLLLFFFPLTLQAQKLLKPGAYSNQKYSEPVVLDTGTYIFQGVVFTVPPLGSQEATWRLGRGPDMIWLDARKAKSITLINCQFTGEKMKGIGVLSSGDLRVKYCSFENMEVGIKQESKPGKNQKVELVHNCFQDNRTAISLNRMPNTSGTATFDFTLKCNQFINNPQTGLSPITRKGLVIGNGVQVTCSDPLGSYPNEIGGQAQFTSGNQYPNANIWPTPDFDYIIPTSGGIPLDVNDVWSNSPNWISIENLSSNVVTYHRFFNEFVGKNNAIVNTSLAPVTFQDESVITSANSSINPNLTTVPVCSLLVDPTPVLFPARVAVVGIDSTTTSIMQFKNVEELEISDPIPNPASGKVLIKANIPYRHEQAVFQILQSGTGRVLQNIDLAKGNKLEITLDVSKSPSGTYHYRMIVDGKATKSKALIVTH